LTDYHLSSTHVDIASHFEERKKDWDEHPATPQDIYDVFAKYCAREIKQLPWCNNQLSAESDDIRGPLMKINKRGFLTINSQPRVNGAKSEDPKFGWGPTGGFVFQKAYVEFFTSPESLKALVKACEKYPYLTYHALNRKGESFTNTILNVSAVTWGVFPSKEIKQPTVVDPDSFVAWKDEAFALWAQWASLYQEGSASHKLLADMINSYFLVNIVDNNFIDGDIFAVFNEI